MHIYDEEIDNLRPNIDIWDNIFSVIDDACCLQYRDEHGKRMHSATFTNDSEPETNVELARIIYGPSTDLLTLTSPFSSDKYLHMGLRFNASQTSQYPIVDDERFYQVKNLSEADKFEIEQMAIIKDLTDTNYINYAGGIWSFDKYTPLTHTKGHIIEISRPEKIINLTAKKNNKLHLGIELRTGQRISREVRMIPNGHIEYFYCAMGLKRISVSNLSYEQSIIKT
jgi:hypothetical protein